MFSVPKEKLLERLSTLRRMEQEALATANQHCGAANALEALIQEFDQEDPPPPLFGHKEDPPQDEPD